MQHIPQETDSNHFDILTVSANPANRETTIWYSVAEEGETSLELFSQDGHRIDQLAGGYHEPGRYNVNFCPDDLPSGIYFAALDNGKYIMTKKLVYRKQSA